jgi:hypothetical protein
MRARAAELYRADPHNQNTIFDIANSLLKSSEVLYDSSSREALQIGQRALELIQTLLPGRQKDYLRAEALLDMLRGYGAIGDFAAAHRALDEGEMLVRQQTTPQRAVAGVYYLQTELAFREGKLNTAVDAGSRFLLAAEQNVADEPDNVNALYDLSRGWDLLTLLHEKRGDRDQGPRLAAEETGYVEGLGPAPHCQSLFESPTGRRGGCPGCCKCGEADSGSAALRLTAPSRAGLGGGGASAIPRWLPWDSLREQLHAIKTAMRGSRWWPRGGQECCQTQHYLQIDQSYLQLDGSEIHPDPILTAYQACAAKWKVPEFRDNCDLPDYPPNFEHQTVCYRSRQSRLGCLSGITGVLVIMSTG